MRNSWSFLLFNLCLLLLLYSCNYNNPPIVSDQEFSVIENAESNSIIDTVKAYDPDMDQILSYSIFSGNHLSAFKIDSLTGIIRVNKSNLLDYEEIDCFDLAVRVTDNGKNKLTACAKITIKLLDKIESIKTGLVAYYPFNGNTLDESGMGNNATNYGAMLTTDRFNRPNSAFEFDGKSDLINSNSTFDFEYRTISLWVMPYEHSGISPYNDVALAQDCPSLNNGLVGVSFEDGKLLLAAGGSGVNSFYFAENTRLNKWFHIVLVRNSNTNLYYINGELVATGFSNSKTSTWDTNCQLIIGAGRSMHLQFFKGKIDDIAIFNRAINQEEVNILYQENFQE